MAAHTPSIHVFLGHPLFLLSSGIYSIINFGSLSSCILLTWPYHWSLFLSMMSIIFGLKYIKVRMSWNKRNNRNNMHGATIIVTTCTVQQ